MANDHLNWEGLDWPGAAPLDADFLVLDSESGQDLFRDINFDPIGSTDAGELFPSPLQNGENSNPYSLSTSDFHEDGVGNPSANQPFQPSGPSEGMWDVLRGIEDTEFAFPPNQPSSQATHASGSYGTDIASSSHEFTIPPKHGTRFSSAVSSALKIWLADHAHQPYPTARDLELLQRQTGLSRLQVRTWLANARRRAKPASSRAPRPPTPSPPSIRTPSPAMIPRGPVAPRFASFESMDPLQRWQNSPPEHEPASVSAIARAISSQDPEECHSPDSTSVDNSGGRRPRSLGHESSAGSTATWESSNGSMSSAYSHASRGSGRSLEFLGKARRRRRRMPTYRPTKSLTKVPHTFQCTFCTETFRTKHNWQRHEKSFHLSLEHWECSPRGPVIVNEKSEVVCVYCGLVGPDRSHIMGHNYAACQERQLEERTFYRKDHLHQHLKLVHDAHFMKWPMEQWKSEVRTIRSRCGFCGIVMRNWADRADHIADHFKSGKSMADWQGDWGFEDSIRDMVENCVPPYMIHYERNSPWPFTTDQGPPETPATAFELIQCEMEYYIANYMMAHHYRPPAEELQYEACSVIFVSELRSVDDSSALAVGPSSTTAAGSWLRDVLMSSPEVTTRARMRPMKSVNKARITPLSIRGKSHIFEGCVVEAKLRQYLYASQYSNNSTAGDNRGQVVEVSDEELQKEAEQIIQDLTASSLQPSQGFKNLLVQLIYGSTDWIAAFRRRADLHLETKDMTNGQFVTATPSALNIRLPSPATTTSKLGVIHSCTRSAAPDLDDIPMDLRNHQLSPSAAAAAAADDGSKTPPCVVHDNNCYRRMTREMCRFVASTMSPRNPNRHIPTDEELQHQARWIMFDDDDPWNQTPFDNLIWLQEFKRDVGLSDTATLSDTPTTSIN